VAAAVTLEAEAGGGITHARIVLGAVADTAIRCEKAEAALLGQPGGKKAFEEAAKLAVESLTPPADLHASSSYRRHLAKVLLERTLAQAWQRR
jgi:CO/xanthine dehydrogenase FAD-binding subunit